MDETWEYGGAADPEATTPEQRFPWPPASSDSALGALGETWKSATFSPRRFFARVPRSGGTGAAVLYYLIIGVLLAGVSLLWDVLARSGADAGAVSEEVADLPMEALDPLAGFLLSPLTLLLGLFVAAGVTHVFLMLFGGARHGFGTTVRVYCFAYSPMIFGVLPYLGTVVGTAWMLALAVIGLREAHESDGWQPVLAVLIPFVLLMVLGGVMALFLVASGLEALLR